MINCVIIVAGGSGNRMKTDIPKQFLKLNGKPILMHTIERFHEFDSSMKVILVLPEKELDYWQVLIEEHNFTVAHEIVFGGATRFHSVKNALDKVLNYKYIAIHDGVRPLVSTETLENCFAAANLYKAVVPVTVPVESIRIIDSQTSHAVNRENFRLVQTPQVFHADCLIAAYKVDYQEFFTDDASVVEHAGYSIHLTEGNKFNIKITTPEDLIIAGMLIKLEKNQKKES